MTRKETSKRCRTATSASALSVVFGPVGIAVMMVAVIGGLWYRNRPQSEAFEPNTTVGAAAMAAIETFPDRGRTHVNSGQAVSYDSDFPTSGPHDPTPVPPGVYSQEQRLEQLVHSIEHGNIVAYVDQPGQAAMDTLTAWTGDFSGPWDGLVVVPKAGLGQEIVLTAWTKKLILPEFEAEPAATFIDAYRGRGPENPVR